MTLAWYSYPILFSYVPGKGVKRAFGRLGSGEVELFVHRYYRTAIARAVSRCGISSCLVKSHIAPGNTTAVSNPGLSRLPGLRGFITCDGRDKETVFFDYGHE